MNERKANQVGCLAGASFLLLFAACGARSSLPICTEPGAIRACENACGSGSQTCVDGDWGACNVAPVSRICSNDCGQGSQTCTAGAWSGCDVPEAVRSCSSACGQGQEKCVDGGWQPCDAPMPGPPTLRATLWNFTATHPDFEHEAGIGLDPGIVAADLGADDKPVYASDASTPSTHGVAYFNQWYRDTPDANLTTTLSLSLAPLRGNQSIDAYENNAFFPIDNQLFGNEGPHNYYFTLELASQFRYTGGETFRFTSDDDSWVFLNRKLAVDLGGVHAAMSGSVDLDLQSQKLGIVKGRTYPMHLFFADRHVVNSVLHIDVTAADFAACSASMP